MWPRKCSQNDYWFNTTQILTAGTVFGPHTPKGVITGVFRSPAVVQTIDPPFHKTDKWIRYRSVIRDGVNETWLNGRLVNVCELTSEYDPWVGIRS
ncbi:MAG: hypothetical protein ABGZ53_15775 [Fuerstiella sp.]